MQTLVRQRVRAAIVTLLLLSPASAYAGSVSLAWDASSGGVAGYTVYYGTASGVYTKSIDVGNQTSTVIRSLTNGVTYYFVVKAYSATQQYSPASNQISAVPVNTAPAITNPGNFSMRTGGLTLPISASDLDQDPLTFSATGLPTGLAINASTGVISGTVGVGTSTIRVTVSDGAAQTSTTFTLTVLADRPPVLTNPGSRTSAENSSVSLQLSATDPDGDPVTFGANGLPPGLSLNSSTGLITGLLSYTSSGTYAVVATATAAGLSDSKSFSWTVTNTNRAPTLGVPGPQTAMVGSPVLVAVSGSDPDGDALTWSASNLPPGLSMGAATGQISGAATTAGSFTATITASDGSATAQASLSFTIAMPPLPGSTATSSPVGSVNTTTPAFAWQAVALATYYVLAVNDAQTASAVQVWITPSQAGCATGTGVCSVASPRSLSYGLVTWKVLTWNVTGYGPWTPVASFVVNGSDATMASPVLSGPSGAIATRTPAFTWTSLANVVWYELSIANGTGAASSWYTPAQVCSGVSCAVAPTTPLAVGAGSWKARAWSATGAGSWSVAMNFDAADMLPGKAAGVAPSGSIGTATPTFTWNAVAGTSYYVLRVTDRDNVSTDRWYLASSVGCVQGTGTCSATPGAMKVGAASWKVLTWNGVGYGPWSDQRDFLIEIPDPAALVPTSLAPTGAITTTNVAYSWTPVAGALSYRLAVRNNGGSASYFWFTPSAAGCDAGGTCLATPSLALTNGTSDWQVQAWTANGYGAWTPLLSLTVAIAAPPTPMLIGPGGAAGSATPTFRWNASANTTLYFVKAIDVTGSRISVWVSPSQAGCASGGVCAMPSGVTLASGAGSWQVIAYNTTGYSPWSAVMTFSVP